MGIPNIYSHSARALNVADQRPNCELAIKWKPPPLDWIKVNFDSFVRNDKAATGFVICD